MLTGIVSRWLGRVNRPRARAEAMVEYALIAASVAFAAVAGWSVLRDHEVAYFESLPMTPVPPSAPGALLHPTLIEPTTCSPSPLRFGDPLDCTVPRVFDALSNPTDRFPPLGTITWFIDGAPIPGGTCALASVTAESSTCGQARIVLSLTDANLADRTHQIWAAYTAPTTNHLPSTGQQYSLFIQRWLLMPKFGANLCQNLVTGEMDVVEEGHPITCSVSLVDLTTPVPPLGVRVHWSADNSVPLSGQGLFTCAAAGDLRLIWQTACSPSETMDCLTDVSGDCSVIYHRLNNAMSRISLPRTDILTVSGASQSWTRNLTVKAAAPHPSVAWQNCAPTSATAVVQEQTITVRQAAFRASAMVDVTGTSVNLHCVAFVIDTGANIALDCVGPASPACSSPGVNPDADAAFQPLGSVSWSSARLAAPKTCQLSTAIVQPAGAPGQVASAAACSVDVTLTRGPGEGPGSGDQGVLTAAYGGPTHGASSFDVQVQFLH